MGRIVQSPLCLAVVVAAGFMLTASAAPSSGPEKAIGDQATGVNVGAPAGGVVLYDFESGGLENWRVLSGNLHSQPVKPTRRGIRYNQQGAYFIGTTETGGTSIKDYDDKLHGAIQSTTFTLRGNFLSFLIGGGNNPDNLYVALIRASDGYVIAKATGIESDTMVRKAWDVSDHRGEACFLRVVDNDRGTWGHISVDDFRFLDAWPKDAFTPVVVAGEFRRIYNPGAGEKTGWYINDHCFVFGPDNLWHLFGITHEEPVKAWDEKNLAHATSPELTRYPWKKLPFALTAEPEPWKERQLWAPHVVYNDGLYYMFYCAGGEHPDQYRIHLATSPDLRVWIRHPENPMFVDGYHARDPDVVRIGNKWVMYYTATSEATGGNHVVAYRTSDDLVHWGDRAIAFTDPSVGKGGGPTESPFVVQRGRFYYLFLSQRGGYSDTDIFQSENPFYWDFEDRVGHVNAHAAEVVRDRDGKWYISHCGWGEGGVYLAPLYWNDGMDAF